MIRKFYAKHEEFFVVLGLIVLFVILYFETMFLKLRDMILIIIEESTQMLFVFAMMCMCFRVKSKAR